MIVYGGGKSGRISRNLQTPYEPEAIETKVCNYCERELPLSHFVTVKQHGRIVHRPICRECECERQRKWKAGLTDEQMRMRTTSKPITITDLETGETADYPSINDAANALNVARSLITTRVKKQSASPIHGRYVVKRKETA